MNVTCERLAELELAEEKLLALEAHGVDNWDSYDDAISEIAAREELIDTYKAMIDEMSMVFGSCAYEPSERGAGIAFDADAESEILSILKQYKVSFDAQQ